jgi:hypothetical protein
VQCVLDLSSIKPGIQPQDLHAGVESIQVIIKPVESAFPHMNNVIRAVAFGQRHIDH